MTNLIAVKYVALLAFKSIVLSHPDLVSQHQDAIMDCIDDLDLSIRLQALELSAGMVNKANLIDLINRLLRQLRQTPVATYTAHDGQSSTLGVEPAADSDGEDPEQVLRLIKADNEEGSVLPSKYKIAIIQQILDMCAANTYANISDFEWYINVLVQLVGLVPADSSIEPESEGTRDLQNYHAQITVEEVSAHIGQELRNVAVRVNSVRYQVVQAAASLILAVGNQTSNVVVGSTSSAALQYAAWIIGEYAGHLEDSDTMLTALTHSKVIMLPSLVLSAYLQAIPKVLIIIMSRASGEWSRENQSTMSLLMARLLYFLEPLTTKPSLEVQERAIELLELVRIASQAVADYPDHYNHWPLFLTEAIPQLFGGSDINPVAPSAQARIPLPIDVDLEMPLNSTLVSVLQEANLDVLPDADPEDFARFYIQRPTKSKSEEQPAASRLHVPSSDASSYQSEEAFTDDKLITRKRLERGLRSVDDPFYIAGEETPPGASTPFHDIIKNTNGGTVDVDSIPIMKLDLGEGLINQSSSEASQDVPKERLAKHYQIAMDEDVDDVSELQPEAGPSSQPRRQNASKRALLQVDSSVLGGLSLEGTSSTGMIETPHQDLSEDTEMVKAVQKVERLRLEMQRASERVSLSQGISAEGTLVKKKKKRVKKAPRTDPVTTSGAEALQGGPGATKASGQVTSVEEDAPMIKRKKRRKPGIAS